MSANSEAQKRAQQIKAMPDDYLRCRELMHAWEEVGSTVTHRGSKHQAVEITEVLQCARCGTERHDRIHTGTWELTGRRYVHPDGYLFSQAGFVLRKHIRAEKFTRTPPKDLKKILKLTG